MVNSIKLPFMFNWALILGETFVALLNTDAWFRRVIAPSVSLQSHC